MKKLYFLTTLSVLILSSCSPDIDENGISTVQNVDIAVLKMTYEITTSIDYQMPPIELSLIDLATVNPSNQKQHIEMQLFEDGQMHMIIEELDFEKKTTVQHQILPDPFPKIVKTVIEGNTVRFYNTKGTLMGAENIPIPNNLEMAKTIKALGDQFSEEDIYDAIATMQGQQFVGNLEKFLNSGAIPRNGTNIIEQGENYVTLRVPFNSIETGMEGESVLLIDKTMNKLVASRTYSIENELLQSTFLGYSQGDKKALNAIRVEEKVTLPSGEEVTQTTNSQIEMLNFSVNIN